MVVGPASSGTRLLTRILRRAVPAWHDRSHGRVRHDRRVVVIVRDPDATDRSRAASWGDRLPTREQSVAWIAEKYPTAPVVRYEELVAAPDRAIARLAEWLGIDPWPAGEAIVDGNRKWQGANA